MKPIIFSIGNFNVYSWGFMMALAVIISVWGCGRLFEKEGYQREWAMDLIVLMALAGLAGSYLLYFVTYDWGLFWSSPSQYWAMHRGGVRGLVWYGGFIAAFIPLTIYIKRKNLSFWKLGDIFAPYLALSYALVRIGCFLAGCCYGKATASFLGVVFPYVDSCSRYPTQLMSSAANLLIFAFLLWSYHRRRFSGQIMGLYLMLYPIYRFIIEYFREPEAMVGSLTQAQFISIIIFLVGALLYAWLSRRQRKQQEWAENEPADN